MIKNNATKRFVFENFLINKRICENLTVFALIFIKKHSANTNLLAKFHNLLFYNRKFIHLAGDYAGLCWRSIHHFVSETNFAKISKYFQAA